jgi:23S rRNA (pseudouridine1915-N3)-methyltransferase
MHLHLVLLGKTIFPEVETGIQRYIDRIRHYVSIETHFLKAERISGKVPEETVKEKEGERILRLTGTQDYLIACDQQGRQFDSQEFSELLGRLRDKGIAHVWMILGGPVGLSSRILEKSALVLSLSKMTFPHDLARLIILEQIYRAFTILKGEPYHK